MPEPNQQISYWDRVAQEKRFSHPLRVQWLESLNARARVLDYGCGYGRTLKQLEEAGFENPIGVDFSMAMLVRCRQDLSRPTLVCNDGHRIPFKHESVDAVLLFATLTCIPHDHDQRSLIAQVKSVLRPGGLLYISDLLLNDDSRNTRRYQKYAEAYGTFGVFELPEGVVVRHHRREWIEDLTASFAELKFEQFKVTTMNGNTSEAFQYLGRKQGD